MTNIQIEMIVATLVLLVLIMFYLKRSSLSVKNSVAWLLLPITFLIICIFPNPIDAISKWLGFETLSNFIFVILIALLIIVTFSLTITVSKQQEQIVKLIQELSILKDKNEPKK